MSESFVRRARLLRYLGYAAGALLALALVLVLGSWLAIRVWAPEFARERLEIALTSALDRPTRVERVSVQPWLGRVVIGNVTAAARPGEPGPHFVKLARLEINLGLSSLWQRRLVLRSIRLDDLDTDDPCGGGPALADRCSQRIIRPARGSRLRTVGSARKARVRRPGNALRIRCRA
jgi:hypothetical protein